MESTTEAAGTIIIDTPNTYLYLILGQGRALRCGVGVGREGFTWAGTQRIAHMIEWPDWHPPPEMIDREPYLPRFTAGSPGNPLGAGRSILAIRSTAFIARISHRPSASLSRPAAITSDTLGDRPQQLQAPGNSLFTFFGEPAERKEFSSFGRKTNACGCDVRSWPGATGRHRPGRNPCTRSPFGPKHSRRECRIIGSVVQCDLCPSHRSSRFPPGSRGIHRIHRTGSVAGECPIWRFAEMPE